MPVSILARPSGRALPFLFTISHSWDLFQSSPDLQVGRYSADVKFADTKCL